MINSAYTTLDYISVDNRTHVTNIDRSVELDQRLEQIADPRIRVSLELQRAFGLLREESLKIQPVYADRGDRLVLKSSWAKADARARFRFEPTLSGRYSIEPIRERELAVWFRRIVRTFSI